MMKKDKFGKIVTGTFSCNGCRYENLRSSNKKVPCGLHCNTNLLTTQIYEPKKRLKLPKIKISIEGWLSIWTFIVIVLLTWAFN